MTESRAQMARSVAAGAAVVAAVLYWLIALGLLTIGRPADGSDPKLFEFGALAGSTFAVVAVLVAFVRSRSLAIGIGLLQVLVIVGYVAASSVREPPFEPWGLLIKASQAVILVAVGYLVLVRQASDTDRPHVSDTEAAKT